MKNPTFAMVLRQLLTYHLLAILLVSRIGIPVYSHVCHEMSESWRSIYLPANACCSWTFQLTGHGCCQAQEASDQTHVEAAPCCENRTDFLALNSGFTLLKQQQLKAHSHHEAEDVSFADHWFGARAQFIESTVESHKSHGPPVTRHGRSLLIAQQVFRC